MNLMDCKVHKVGAQTAPREGTTLHAVETAGV